MKAKKTPQKVKYSFLKILTGSDLSSRRLPFMAVESSVQGPVVWLTGCMHGDEVTGIVTIQEVFKRVQKQHLLRGSLYAFPLMNPMGFETGSRNITLSREDLNRSFPGNKDGSLAERIADRVFSTIQHTNPHLVLDIHNDWMKSIPYVLLDSVPGDSQEKACESAAAIAQKLGFIVALETENIEKSLSFSLLQSGIPALTIELGESCVVNEKNVETGVKSILGALAHLEMIDPIESGLPSQLPEEFAGKTLKFSFGQVSSASGIIRFSARPGDIVRTGQIVAGIYNTFGKLQGQIRCVDDGIVLGHSDSSVAFPGAPVMAFAVASR